MAGAPWSRILPALTGLGLLYLVSQLARNAMGVISGDIESALALRATQTALLAGATFLAYGLCQIPAAALLTRFGPRVVLPAAAALLALSFLGFAAAESFSGLLAARLAMGVAAAPVLAGAYAVFTGFGEERFTTLTGLQTAFGRAGVVVATTPLALLVAAIGWREALAWAAAAAAAAGVAATLVLFTLAKPASKQGSKDGASVLRSLIASGGFRAAAVFQGVASATSGTILALWGGPWLANVYGFDVRDRGAMLLAMALAAFASAPLWGRLAVQTRARSLILAAAVLAAGLLALPAILRLPEAALLPWLAAVGLTTGFYPAVLAELRRVLPPGMIVHLSTLLTAGTMLVVFLVQLATGLLADQFPGTPGHHPEAAYRVIFALLGGLLLGAALLYHAGTARPNGHNQR